MDNNSILKLLLCSSATIALTLGNAYAQTPTPDEEEEVTTSSDEVVVTGSRIRSDTFSSPVAMDVLTVEEAKIEGIADIGGLLQTSTAASGSSQVTAAVSAAFVADGGLGAETVGLRGLAANRTLDLINGRRAGPSGVRGSINSFDLNSIPLAGIERVDILKDGASSIYGSDAIAGVINYITDKSDGKSIDAFTSFSGEGGGEVFRISGSWGETFERGRVRVTGDYFQEKELARGDRSYLDCDEAYAYNPGSVNDRIDVIDPRTGKPQCRDLLWGHIWIYDYAGTNTPNSFPNIAQFDYDGSLAAAGLPGYLPSPGGVQSPAGWFPIYYDQDDIDGNPTFAGINVGDRARGLVNFDHPFQNAETLSPAVERFTVMADGEFELTPNTTVYAEALLNRRVTTANGYRQYWSYVYGEDAIFTGGTNTNPTSAGWSGLQWFSPTAITDKNDQETTIDYMRFVAGLTGSLPEDTPLIGGWTWDAYVQRSDSHGEYVEDQIYNDSIRNYNFSTEVCENIDNGNGLGITSGATGNGVTVAGRPCVNVPWFSEDLMAGIISPEVEQFLFFVSEGSTDYIQNTAEAYISGDLVELPAGSLDLAVGVFYQTDEINDVPDDQILAGNVWGSSSAGITAGEQNTSAIYLEARVPLLENKPLIESLSFTGSYRFNEIETIRTTGESITTDGENYRVSLDYQMLPSLRFRATQGTSFRSPGLFEQFLGNETSFASQRSIDPCIQINQNLANGSISQRTFDNCRADLISIGASAAEAENYVGGAITADVFRGGGFGVLNPETSENFTYGVVWTPDFADLSIALDYFDITIEDEIATLSAGQITAGCYASENFGSEPLCNLFNRNPAGPDGLRITDVTATFININSQTNNGLDFTLRYGFDTKFGRFDLNTQWTHQLEAQQLLLADDEVFDNNGELGEPKTTGFANLTFDPGENWRLRYSINHIGGTSNRDRFARNNPNPTLYGVPALYKNHTEAITYHGVSGEYFLDSGWTIRGGINNLFDEHPPAVSAADSGNSPIRSQYDYLGRSFFLNVTKRFD